MRRSPGTTFIEMPAARTLSRAASCSASFSMLVDMGLRVPRFALTVKTGVSCLQVEALLFFLLTHLLRQFAAPIELTDIPLSLLFEFLRLFVALLFMP